MPLVKSEIQSQILASSFFKEDIIRSYALSKKYGLLRCQEKISPDLVKGFDVLSNLKADPKELDYIDIHDVERILFYRRKRAEKARGILAKFSTHTVEACECRRVFDVPYGEDADPGVCEAWVNFLEVCEERLRNQPTVDISARYIRDEACCFSKCPDSWTNLFDHSEDVLRAA
ncbi:hypothetical protein SISNIDRAFT_553066 [Sistotremastrum niveocremeum HHB9708]|uniref:Uncharacterized protein n=1 Tax=Sistotremastrum niveocremeum HHB9708 TaxID=1314777 RepID=A0A164NE09_9AGAM|nr:hypothetical protein SISNIDRAFT_553066 [Sistotremastrum niveocremeum HHB9708]